MNVRAEPAKAGMIGDRTGSTRLTTTSPPLDGADGDPVRAVAEARLARAGYLHAGLLGHANLAAIERWLRAQGC